MSRVRWRFLVSKERFEFAHNLAGRLVEPLQHDQRAWAVLGRASFLTSVVPALLSAGCNVVALSVAPTAWYDVTQRLKAQDAQDRLVVALNVAIGVSPEALEHCDAFETLLCDTHVIKNARRAAEQATCERRLLYAQQPEAPGLDGQWRSIAQALRSISA